ncbi:MAG: tryptophan synthase subunit beta, partial [Halodesulfurarchaeum sp.]
MNDGEFERYGGRHVPEPLEEPLEKLAAAYDDLKDDPAFRADLEDLLETFAGRPTPIYHARRLSDRYGAEIYLKREDLLHGGAHKINNALGQGLLAKRAGKDRLIAET